MAGNDCLAGGARREPTEVSLLSSMAKHSFGVGPAEPNAAPDHGGTTATQGSLPLQPPRQVSLIVLASGKAWERGKRCNRNSLETFRRNPVGNQSHLVELASSQK